LSGDEAATFGSVIASASNAIKDATGADLVYVYVFGDSVAHLHVHLAPHRHDGSPLSNQMIKGARHEVTLASGAEVWASDRYPLQPTDIMEAAIKDIATALNPTPEADG
ncbi:MAG: hypothetical protein ACR2N7_00860, partial [Acidimicrobiia bacterium]